RPLHTLKGGARMAGVMTMGDLAHELESLIIGIEVGSVPPSREAREALQRSLDELAHMRDLMAANAPVPAARALLRQVRVLNGSAPAAPAVSAPVVAAAVVPDSPVSVPTAAAEAEATDAEAADAETVEETGPSEPVTATDATTAPGAAFTSEAAAESTISPADDVLAASGGPAADFSATEFTSTAFSATASFVAAPSNVVELPARPQTPAPYVDPPASLAPPAPPVFRAPTLAAPPPTFQRLMAAAAVPPGREPSAPADRVEMARVDAELLNQLLNQAEIGRAHV